MSPRDVTGKHKVKECKACTECNYNAIGGDNILHKSNQQTKSLTPMYKNYRRIMKPTVLQFHSVHASPQFFTAYFAVTSFGLILVSDVHITAVVVQ
jgi:hypothetical protein